MTIPKNVTFVGNAAFSGCWSLNSVTVYSENVVFEEIASLSHSVVFLHFFALFIEEGFLISPCYSLKICMQLVYLSLPPLPFAFLLSSAICKTSSDNHFAFLHFFFLGMVLVTASCKIYETPSIVLQALCLPDLIP